jgi:hypothetical protein
MAYDMKQTAIIEENFIAKIVSHEEGKMHQRGIDYEYCDYLEDMPLATM